MRAHGGRTVLLAVVVTAVTGLVGIGLWSVGAPGEARRHRLDAARLDDLRCLAGAVDLLWTRHGELPEDLDGAAREVRTDCRVDPESHEPYPYRRTGESTYELCATFAFGSERAQAYRYAYRGVPDFWHHGPGRWCFGLQAEQVER